MRIGVLALQGGFAEHSDALAALGAAPKRVRSPSDLVAIDGLVIPGGESTTIALLADRTGVRGPVCDLIDSGFPVFGTCAGMIMLADRVVDGRADRQPFGGIDMTVQRNAFGRQRDSFETLVDCSPIGIGRFPAVFIRAPAVVETGPGVVAVATVQHADTTEVRVVAVKDRNKLAVAFHPELTDDTRIHEYFLQMVKGDID